MHRRGALRPSGLELAVGPRDRVVQSEHLRDPRPQPPVVGVERREPPYVDAHQVVLRLPGDDPLGERTSGPTGRGDADRVEAGADEEAAQRRRLAEQELVVGGERLRAVVELADPGVLQRRDPAYGLVHQHREVVPVLLEELELERVRQVVGRAPRFGLGLEAADHQAAGLLLEVGPAVRVAHDRQVWVDALDPLGDDVEVLGRVQRHAHADQVTERLGPLAGAVDDDLGLDVAAVGAYAGHPAVGHGEARSHAPARRSGRPAAARPWPATG